MIRPIALTAALVVSLLAVSGAGGASAQTPKRGGTVAIATASFLEPACLNALIDTCRPAPATLDALALVLDGAFEVKPDATFRPVLVTGAEIVSRRPFTLHYRIRSEARWSDGVQVTAKDFVFTHRTMSRYQPDSWADVTGVRELDAKTVRVVLRDPDPDWRYLFDPVLPSHALGGADFASVWKDAIDNPRTGRAIGSGPFLFSRWVRGTELTFVRNPRYGGQHTSYLERIVWRFIPPGDAADALRRGEVDMIEPGPAPLAAAALQLHREGTPGIRVLPVLTGLWEHLAIRIGPGSHRALKKPLVRRALAYGIDRRAIAREAAALTSAAPHPQDSVVFLANSAHYQPNWKAYRYRPAQSRRLLEQAGCRKGSDGIYFCDGERLELRFATGSGIDRRKRTLELAQAQLRRVGVEVRLVFAPPAVFAGTVLPSGDFDVAQFGWIQDASTAGPLSIYGCQQPSNFTGYCSRLVTRDLDQAARTLDEARRVRLLNRIDARLAKAVPDIPLYQLTGLQAFKATVRGVVPNGVGRHVWNAEDWWLDR